MAPFLGGLPAGDCGALNINDPIDIQHAAETVSAFAYTLVQMLLMVNLDHEMAKLLFAIQIHTSRWPFVLGALLELNMLVAIPSRCVSQRCEFRAVAFQKEAFQRLTLQ